MAGSDFCVRIVATAAFAATVGETCEAFAAGDTSERLEVERRYRITRNGLGLSAVAPG